MMTHQSESLDNIIRAMSDCVLWETNPSGGRGREREEGKKNKGDRVKGHLFLNKYSAL